MAQTTNAYRQRPNVETKMLGNDRVLKLIQRNPDPPSTDPLTKGSTRTSPGLIGREVFTGGNKLHAIYNEDSGLWSLKLDHGNVPAPLRQWFTSFSQLWKVTVSYFDGKEIDVIEE